MRNHIWRVRYGRWPCVYGDYCQPHERECNILGWQLIGALPAIGIMIWLAFTPNKAQLFLALGLLPILLWLPKGILAGDAEKPSHAALCGAMVMGLNLSAGVAGPALDFFYVKTALTRKAIVATKAVLKKRQLSDPTDIFVAAKTAQPQRHLVKRR